MLNYYTILGLLPQSDGTAVRAAYKRLAMAYHPDHNPGNPEAEELFKMVNEAYQTLSSPAKRAAYDAILFPQYIPPRDFNYERPRRNLRRPAAPRPYYRIDRQYFRTQALSLAVFLALAGFAFVLMNTIHYVVERRQQQAYQKESFELRQAGNLFAQGNFDGAFSAVRRLTQQSPLEYRIRHAHDSLAHALRSLANDRFNAGSYHDAATLYQILEQQEDPPSAETLRKIAMSQYYIGNYARSMAAMTVLHQRFPNNAELLYPLDSVYVAMVRGLEAGTDKDFQVR